MVEEFVWWLLLSFIVGVTLGYICPIGRPKRRKVVGTLYVTPPEKKDDDPYLYLQVSDYSAIFEQTRGYILFKLVHKRE